LHTDVPTLKGQAGQQESSLECLALEDWTNVFQNVDIQYQSGSSRRIPLGCLIDPWRWDWQVVPKRR